MGSCKNIVTTETLTMSLQAIVPVLEYFQDPVVQEKVMEVGRVIYSNNSITVNLGAIIAAGALALLAGGLLFYFLFAGQDSGTSGGGYGDPYGGTSGYEDYAHSRSINDLGNFVTNLIGSDHSDASYPVTDGLGSRAWNTANLAANNLIN